MITRLASLSGTVASVLDAGRGLLWVAEAGTMALGAIDLATGGRIAGRPLSAVPTGLALRADGAELLLASDDGSLVGIDPDDPAGSPLRTLLTGVGPLGQVAASRDPAGVGEAVVRNAAGDTLMTVDLVSGARRPDEGPYQGLTGVAVDAHGKWVATTVSGEGSVAATSGPAVVSAYHGLPPTGHLGLSDDGLTLLVVHPGDAALSVISLLSGVIRTASVWVVVGPLREAHLASDGSVLLVGEDAVARADSMADVQARSPLFPPTRPLFVGSWAELDVDLRGLGLGPDDVGFRVPDGPEAGCVSYARHDAPPAAGPVPLLIAGGRPGTYPLEMLEVATGATLAATQFEVTAEWHDPETGPSRCSCGVEYEQQVLLSWGGGPNAAQNVPRQPRTGTWRVAILMVDTASGAYPTNPAALAAIQTELLNHVTDGAAFGGRLRSVRQYVEEVSNYDPAVVGRGLTLDVLNHRVYGPVALPNEWDSYFAQARDGTAVDALWAPIPTTTQSVITAALLAGAMTHRDFSGIDTLIIVPCSPDTAGGPPARFAWPHASPSPVMVMTGFTGFDWQTLHYIYVSPDFAAHAGRQVHTALSHEIGHNFGLPDLYAKGELTADVANRLVSDWDMMGEGSDELPHYTLSNRMRQGWVDPQLHLRRFDFRGMGGVNDLVALHAVELSPPPPGTFRGIEIRIADGWNYYVEYRAMQPGQIGDRLPQDRRVVITDVTSDDFRAPTTRPPIIFVRADAGGDGPILPSGSDFQETDPGTQMVLVVRVLATTADTATVRIEYGSNGRPDPGIRPWEGSPDWKSPDIEVRNAKSLADPARWANVPWVGRKNTVVAKVRNHGDLLAVGARCEFFAVELTTGDGPMVWVGGETHDLPPAPPASTPVPVEFTTEWVPPREGHYCLVVRLPLYQDPALPSIIESNIFNNEARSNYTRFVSASSSPSTRVGGSVQLANPYRVSTLVQAVVRQSSRLHRVYLDHQWLRVPGYGSRSVRVFDEALIGTPEIAYFGSEHALTEEIWNLPNRISIEGWADTPFESDCRSPTLTGGVSMRVDAARATAIEIDQASRSFVSGRVWLVGSGEAVSTGLVLVAVHSVDNPTDPFTTTRNVQSDGTFALEFNSRLPDHTDVVLQVEYLGAVGYAPCESREVRVEA